MFFWIFYDHLMQSRECRTFCFYTSWGFHSYWISSCVRTSLVIHQELGTIRNCHQCILIFQRTHHWSSSQSALSVFLKRPFTHIQNKVVERNLALFKFITYMKLVKVLSFRWHIGECRSRRTSNSSPFLRCDKISSLSEVGSRDFFVRE